MDDMADPDGADDANQASDGDSADTAPGPDAAPGTDGTDQALALAGEDVDWFPCGDLTQCATVDVPVDYDDPSLGQLALSISVRRSTDPDQRIGYLFINPGGPGVSGVDLVIAADLIGFPQELLDSFDLVGFDPRGVGGSEPSFACGEGTEQFDLLSRIDDLPDEPEELALGAQAVQLCVDSMGPVAARLGSPFVAQDIDAIRRALGAEQISYLGFSYGSALGAWYASLFPDQVRAMVVDGARNPLADAETLDERVQLAREQVGPVEAQFRAALESCDSEACPIYNDGDPTGFWLDTAPKLDLIAQAKNDNPTAISFAIIGHLYTEQLWPDLHQAIFDLNVNDDPTGFVAAIENAGQVDEPSFTAHVNCLDAWALFPDETVDDLVFEAQLYDQAVEDIIWAEFPLLGASRLPDNADVCLHYETIDVPAFEGTLDGGDVPIVVIGNTSDPITPFVQSEQFANDVLANGHLVRVQHPQHVVYPANGCVNDIVHAALIDLELPPAGVECAAQGPPRLAEIEMVAVELDDGATSVRPAGWLQLTPNIYAQSSNPSDPITLIFQPTFGVPETALESFAGELGGAPRLINQVELPNGVWTIQEIILEVDTLVLRSATLQGTDGIIVIGQAAPDDIERLTSEVILPAAEAFQPAG